MQFQKENRLAYLNFLRGKYESFTGEVLVRSYPSYLGIDPTSICQLRCPHCPTGVENEARKSGQAISFRNRTMLTSDVFDALLDEVGEYLFLIMFYNWGEPLLNKDLPSLIKKAKPWNIYTEIHTNLSLRLTDQRIEELLVSGIDELSASIDGFSQPTYETYRRGGDFELARTNLERMVEIRDRLGLKTRLIWAFLVFSFNEHEIEATRSFCEERGIIFNRREAFTDNPDWLPSYRKGQLGKLAPAPAAVEGPAPAPTAPVALSPCDWHYTYTMVNADGSVSPCCAPWEQKHDFGTVVPGRVSLADIWNNSNYRKSRAAFANKEIKGLGQVDTLCLRCPFGKGVQQQYTAHDASVINQFRRLPKGWDPLIEQAFDRLDDRPAFVRFFADNLSNDFRATVDSARGIVPTRAVPAEFLPRKRSHATVLLRRAARRLRTAVLALKPRPPVAAEPARVDTKECNICGWRGRAFEGGAHSESAVCPSCNSISRDRFLYYCFTQRTELRRELRVLETSPRLGAEYRRGMKERFEYLCSDYDGHAHRADLQVDLQAIDLADESLDVVLTPHVLEHVPDTDKALAELRRVLRPGGKIFIQVPLLQGKTSVPVKPEYHGDNTLVYWRFGWDLTDKIRGQGFDCTVLVLEDLRRRCVERRSDWEARSPEFDIESIVSNARPGDLTAVADETGAGRHGLDPSYMYVTWECTKPSAAASVTG